MLTQRLVRPNLAQRKLLMSLAANFSTRVPGALGVIFFLPLLRFSLGTAEYSLLFASLSLGSAAAFLFGGIGTVARRMIGEAHSIGDLQAEADAFQTIVRGVGVATLVSVVLGGAYAATRSSSTAVIIVALLPIIASAGGMFDNIRAAYNEHYVTATLQFVLQVSFYAAGFLIPAVRHDLVLSALVLVGSNGVASVIALALLLHRRPHLLRGRPAGLLPVLRQGLVIAFADGMLTTGLSIAVVAIQAGEPAEVSAWFATLVRLFWALLAPVILLILPVSSYVRILWVSKSPAQQYGILRATLLFSAAYSLLTALALFLLSHLYIERLLHLPAPDQWWQVAGIFAFLTAIIVFKSYANVAYVVLDANHFSLTVSAGLIVAAAIAGAAALAGPSVLSVVSIYSACAAMAIGVVLLVSLRRFGRQQEAAGRA